MSDGEPLGLPDPIEASPSTIRAGADDLDELHEDMLGQSEDTDTQMRSSADEFTDLVAWDISSASADELMAWEEASKALTYGAGVLRLWAEDIDTYMRARDSLEGRWEEARDGLWTESLSELREELLLEHLEHWRTLMDQADQTASDLRNGPSKDTLERMAELGILSAGQIATYGDHYPGMVPDEIDGSEPPHEVNAWWGSLSEDEREQAMADDPALLRDLDGIPSNVRDQLNRDHLANEQDDVKDEIDELEAELDDLAHAPGNDLKRSILENEIEELEGHRASMEELHENLNDSANETDQYLLAFERGEHGRAIVSNGNPDTADNVATMVPGTGSTWQSINGQMEHAEAVRQAAEQDGSNSPDTATISWIGYDAPSELEVGSIELAENAAGELGEFHSGLRATHENTTPSNNTIIGHSYGSTVVGHSATSEAGLDADELIFVGSPGVSASGVHELGFAPENVHSATAANDNISYVPPRHGTDPSSSAFGANVFATNPGPKGGDPPLGTAHKQDVYFNLNNDSMDHIGSVISGEYNENR